jgi:hypothetical protein
LFIGCSPGKEWEFPGEGTVLYIDDLPFQDDPVWYHSLQIHVFPSLTLNLLNFDNHYISLFIYAIKYNALL